MDTELQDVTGSEPAPETIVPLRAGHAETIARYVTLLGYQESIVASLHNELRQFLLVAYGVDMNIQAVQFDAQANAIRFA